MRSIKEQIRDGIVTTNGEDVYRSVFIGKNFYVFRRVKKGLGYRGNTYKSDGYIQAFADIQEPPNDPVPSFVSMIYEELK